MRRRDFVAGLAGATALPASTQAQQQALPVIGYLAEDSGWSPLSKAVFARGLAESGYFEGRNVAIEGRFAMGDKAALGELAADLVRRRVAVIATPATLLGTLAAKAETKTIPIVFSVSVDPVRTGLSRA
jgi:putative ABC transport system substrate-binding protein